ncbi:MAG: hypothetical protein C6W57_05780 [Caldibacillus debilis]|nr:MAG: hypothetical protein C6W57_05780 [Caldibacillus debilis]
MQVPIAPVPFSGILHLAFFAGKLAAPLIAGSGMGRKPACGRLSPDRRPGLRRKLRAVFFQQKKEAFPSPLVQICIIVIRRRRQAGKTGSLESALRRLPAEQNGSVYPKTGPEGLGTILAIPGGILSYARMKERGKSLRARPGKPAAFEVFRRSPPDRVFAGLGRSSVFPETGDGRMGIRTLPVAERKGSSAFPRGTEGHGYFPKMVKRRFFLWVSEKNQK